MSCVQPSHIVLKEIPRFECLLEMSKRYPYLEPVACEGFLHLLRMGDEVFRVMQAHFARHNISKGRFIVLMLLSESVANNAGRTPAELAEMSSCTRATMTGLVDSLERDGFVMRSPDASDRRMMRVSLTKAGTDFMAQFLPDHFKRITHLMGALTPEEQKTLVALTAKVIDRCSSLEPAPAPSAESIS